jgi:hypothetical protein
MNMQRITVKAELERMVLNYHLLGSLEERETDKILAVFDSVLPSREKAVGKITPFPAMTEAQKPIPPREKTEPVEIFAPIGKPIPKGYPDYRPVLQRDGLILVSWIKIVHQVKGVFFNIQWIKSAGRARTILWSGYVREKELPNAFPDENKNLFWDEKDEVYRIKVAPDELLHGTMDFRAEYIKILKSGGVTVDFDYAFYLPAERKNRFEEKNKELLAMGFSGKPLNILNSLEIYTAADLLTLTEEILLETESCGAGTVREIKDILAKNNIELWRKQHEQSTEVKERPAWKEGKHPSA